MLLIVESDLKVKDLMVWFVMNLIVDDIGGVNGDEVSIG